MLEDRDYMRDESAAGGLFGAGAGAGRWSALKIIIALNIAVFVLQHIFKLSFLVEPLPGGYERLAGSLSLGALQEGRVWTLVTHMFVHSGFEIGGPGGLGFLHILFNLLILYFAGRLIESRLGEKRFLIIYFGAGLAGAAMQLTFVNLLLGSDAAMVGASGGALGMLIAATVIEPEARMQLLFFPVSFRAGTLGKVLLWVFAGFALLEYVPMGGVSDSVIRRTAHHAHLGGALFGLLYARHAVRTGAARAFGWGAPVVPMSRGKGFRKWTGKLGRGKSVEANVIRQSTSRGKRSHDAETDAILEKVSREGIHSLSARERKILQSASEQMRKRDRPS